jgi:hypothetical protein
MVEMAQAESQPIAVIETSSLKNREELLTMARELKAILKEAIAILS